MEAQHQQHYHYQYTTHNDASSSTLSLSDDPYHLQSHYQSTQSYYAYLHDHYAQPQQQQQPQQDYPSYYYPNYSSSYHIQTDPNSIHPPGVPIPAETQQSHLQTAQNSYYQHGFSATQPPPSQGYMLQGNSTYKGAGSHTSPSLRSGGPSSFGRHGRGRGGGRGKHAPPQTLGSSGPTAAASGKAPPQKAWCELCKVECNTLEILEQHKNGKKHQKNLKVHEELQNLSRKQTQNPQMPVSQSNLKNIPSNKVEGCASEPATKKTKVETTSRTDETAKAELSSGATPSEKSVRKDRFNGRGGLKRSMRGGYGGKRMKTHDGSRRSVEPLKPKLGFPVVCQLCNVKCESQVVYESHLAGKKHLANAKRVQGNKETVGEGLQALYPTIPNLPSTSITPQAYQQGSQDAQALASLMLSQQNLQDPQAAHAALAQLLSQHGIHDAQTLLVQLIPYLLAQFQVAGSVATPLAGLGVMNIQNPQSQGPALPSVLGGQNRVIESMPEQQNVINKPETEAGEGKKDESDQGKSLDKQVEGQPENNNAGNLQVSSGPTKEESSILGQEKQSS